MNRPQKFLLFLLTGTLAGCLPVLQPVDTPNYGDFTCSSTMDELGDAIVDAGLQTPPTTICGQMDSTGNDGDKYTEDRDNTKFRVTTSGEHRFTLEWDATNGDYDLYLYDELQVESDTGQEKIPPLDFASSGGYPEQFTAPLQPGRDYMLVVVGWKGDASRWGVTIQPGGS